MPTSVPRSGQAAELTAELAANRSSTGGWVFLCHAAEDMPAVLDLHNGLRRDGVPTWLDVVNLLPGQDLGREIRRAIRASRAVLICLSTMSVDRPGRQQKEIRIALDAADEQPDGASFVIPVLLDRCDVPDRLRRWSRVDLFEPHGYERLLSVLPSRRMT